MGRRTRLVVGERQPDYVVDSVRYGEEGICYASMDMDGPRPSRFSVCMGGHPLGTYAKSADSGVDFDIYHLFLDRKPWKVCRTSESFPEDIFPELSRDEVEVLEGAEAEYELAPDESMTVIQPAFPLQEGKEVSFARKLSVLAADLMNGMVAGKWSRPDILLEEFSESSGVDVLDFRSEEDLPAEFQGLKG